MPHINNSECDADPTCARCAGGVPNLSSAAITGNRARAAQRAVRVLPLTTLFLASVVGACGSATVSVTPPTPTDAAVSDTCAALKESLPARLQGLHTSKTTPESDLTAAWSDAASNVVTLRCGVESFDTATGDILSVNDVDWSPVERERGTSFVTVGRSVTVQVDVPMALRPEASYLVPLADALAAAVSLAN